MAWLNATPEGEKKSRRESLLDGGDGSPFLFLPPVENLEYILELWHDAGTIESSTGGISRLSWQEIDAWLRLREVNEELPLTYWEISMVRKLSEEYSSEYNLASSKNRPAPYQESFDIKVGKSMLKGLLQGVSKKQEPKYEVELRED